MTAKTIAIAQQKGGAGKTTIAVQLAVAWARQGLKVAMLDVDPQGSLSAWYGMRKDAGVESSLAALDVQGWKLATEIDRLKSDYDLLVVDTPPHAETDPYSPAPWTCGPPSPPWKWPSARRARPCWC